MSSEAEACRVPGSYVRGIACGGRHSAVITGKHSCDCLNGILNTDHDTI